MMTNIVDCDFDALAIGQAVKVVFKPDATAARRCRCSPRGSPPSAWRSRGGTLSARDRHRRHVHGFQPPRRAHRRARELQVADRAGRSGPRGARRLPGSRGRAGVRPGGARLPGPRRDDRDQHRHPAQRRGAGAAGHRGLRRRARDPAAPAREPGELHRHAPAAAHPPLPGGRGDRAHPGRRHGGHHARPRRAPPRGDPARGAGGRRGPRGLVRQCLPRARPRGRGAQGAGRAVPRSPRHVLA